MFYINSDKLNDINLNNNNFYVAMDFDKTITTNDSLDSWTVIQNPNIVNPNLSKDSMLLFEKYGPLELDYSLDNSIKSAYLNEWYYKVMDLYYKYDLTYSQLLDCVYSGNVVFRDGLIDFLRNLNKYNIPIVILSAGIGNVIVEVLKLNNCLYDNICIVSNFLEFKNNKILPFTDKIIHSSNKSITNLPNSFMKKIEDKAYCLLFGDLIDDLNMVPKEDLYKTLSVGFLERNVDTNLNLYKNSFDIVLTDNSSFSDVQNILIKQKRNILKND